MSFADQQVYAGVSTGSANAQAVALSNVGSIADLLGVRVTWTANLGNTGPMTLALAGTAPVAVEKIGFSGLQPLVGGEVVPGAQVTTMYNGISHLLVSWVPNLMVGGLETGLTITTLSSTTLSVAVDQIMLQAVTGEIVLARAVNVTVDTAVTGAGGVDVGSVATATSYDIYVGYNQTTRQSTAWLTIEGNVPTVPAGYGYYWRVGWTRTDSVADLYWIRQINKKWFYDLQASGNTANLPIIANGAVGNISGPTYVAIPLSGIIPVKSNTVILGFAANGSGFDGIYVAPSPAWPGYAEGYPNIAYGFIGPGDGTTHSELQLIGSPPVMYLAQQSNAWTGVAGGTLRT